MKKLFLAALAVATLASCSKEANDIDSGDGKVVDAKLQISFVSSDTKAIVSDNDRANIYDANLFVINGDNSIQKKFYVSNAEISNITTTPLEYAVTTAAKKVIVVANVGDLVSVGGDAASVINVTQLEKVFGELSNVLTDAARPQIWMSGQESVSFVDGPAATDGTSPLAKVQMTLSIIPARIDVTVTNSMENKDAVVGEKIVIDGVAVLYSAAYTRYLSPFVVAESDIIAPYGKYYQSGVSANWPSKSTNNSDNLDLNKSWADYLTAQFKETFYALPGDGADGRNTILVVHGTFDSQKLYFPVIFNNEDIIGKSLENGNRYILNIELKGDALMGGGGTTDPETPVFKAFMTVKVTAGDWIAGGTFNKEFN